MSEQLITKYRPKTLDEVWGQDAALDALENAMSNNARVYLFVGPSGVGKTTLAKITANELGATEVFEIDGATHNGVEEMRSVANIMSHRPFGDKKRTVIIDECHRLSGNAWDSLLTKLESPPPYSIWLFCTTNPAKLPTTFKTRAACITLKPVAERDLSDLLEFVCHKEKIKLDPDVGRYLVAEAGGSPRQLLSNLAVCSTAKTRREAAAMLAKTVESDPVIELCRALNKPGSWSACMDIVKKLETVEPESCRIIIVNYFGKALENAKADKEAVRFLTILDAFATPYNPVEKKAPLLLSLGKIFFG